MLYISLQLIISTVQFSLNVVFIEKCLIKYKLFLQFIKNINGCIKNNDRTCVQNMVIWHPCREIYRRCITKIYFYNMGKVCECRVCQNYFLHNTCMWCSTNNYHQMWTLGNLCIKPKVFLVISTTNRVVFDWKLINRINFQSIAARFDVWYLIVWY